MLDQSFSIDNFRIIIDVENRKGKYIEDKDYFEGEDLFKNSKIITDKIIELNNEIRLEKRKLPPIRKRTDENYIEINKLYIKKEQLLEEREKEREIALLKIESNVNNPDFHINIEEGIKKHGKQTYITKNTPENYFVLKQLQRNIYKTFGVKQANRKTIISQLKMSLYDNFPKLIIRTDITSLYENIPHNELLNKIEENSLLSYSSKKIIKDILNQYWKILIINGEKSIRDNRVGIPRGLGISAYLSELYLNDLDKTISSLSNITYYARYVDDIITIFTPKNKNEAKTVDNYINEISEKIDKYKLNINISKTESIDLRKYSNKACKINYLGYSFIISNDKKKNEIRMSDQKLDKNKQKIIKTFNAFKSDISKYTGKENQTNKLLIQRIKLLTHNVQLYNRKSRIYVGIYFSNEFLTSREDLKSLDDLLKIEINNVDNILPSAVKEKISSYSFIDGYEKRKMININFNKRNKKGTFDIKRVKTIWNEL